MTLSGDREGREAVLHCLAAVHASRMGLAVHVPWEGADRALPFEAMTELAVAALAELEARGGDPAEFLGRVYAHVTTAEEEAGHG